MVKNTWILLVASYLVYSIVINVLIHDNNTSPLTKEVRQGWDLWQNKNCQACHQLYGLGGYMGPDLTNAVSTIGKGTIEALLKSGTSRMPDFHLKQEEIDRIYSFLEWVDKTGKTRVDPKDVHWSGTYIIRQDG